MFWTIFLCWLNNDSIPQIHQHRSGQFYILSCPSRSCYGWSEYRESHYCKQEDKLHLLPPGRELVGTVRSLPIRWYRTHPLTIQTIIVIERWYVPEVSLIGGILDVIANCFKHSAGGGNVAAVENLRVVVRLGYVLASTSSRSHNRKQRDVNQPGREQQETFRASDEVECQGNWFVNDPFHRGKHGM